MKRTNKTTATPSSFTGACILDGALLTADPTDPALLSVPTAQRERAMFAQLAQGLLMYLVSHHQNEQQQGPIADEGQIINLLTSYRILGYLTAATPEGQARLQAQRDQLRAELLELLDKPPYPSGRQRIVSS